MELGDDQKVHFLPVNFVIVESHEKMYYCVDSQSYGNLSINLEQIQEHIRKSKFVTDTYKSYYE